MAGTTPTPERRWSAFHSDGAPCVQATTTHDCPMSHRYEPVSADDRKRFGDRSRTDGHVTAFMFSSRPPFNDDPLPWLGKPEGSGMPNRYGSPEAAEGAPFWDTATHEARPEFERPQHNPTNHALAHFRELHGRKSGPALTNAAVHWNASLRDMRIAGAYTAVEEHHARLVLNRLIRLAKESA